MCAAAVNANYMFILSIINGAENVFENSETANVVRQYYVVYTCGVYTCM